MDGYKFRWVRTAINGQSDVRNVSVRRREGWEPCRAEDHPELALSLDDSSKQSGNVEIGGLMLCKAPVERQIVVKSITRIKPVNSSLLLRIILCERMIRGCLYIQIKSQPRHSVKVINLGDRKWQLLLPPLG